jgi:hypothetical protein
MAEKKAPAKKPASNEALIKNILQKLSGAVTIFNEQEHVVIRQDLLNQARSLIGTLRK